MAERHSPGEFTGKDTGVEDSYVKASYRLLPEKDLEEDRMPHECTEPNSPLRVYFSTLESTFPRSIVHGPQHSTENRGAFFDSGFPSTGETSSCDWNPDSIEGDSTFSNTSRQALDSMHDSAMTDSLQCLQMSTYMNTMNRSDGFNSNVLDNSDNIIRMATDTASGEKLSDIQKKMGEMHLTSDYRVSSTRTPRTFDTETFPESESESRHVSTEYHERGELTDINRLGIAIQIYEQDDDGDNQLHMSIIHEMHNYTIYFISVAPEFGWLNKRNNLSQTALHLATITRQDKIVRRLMVGGADVDVMDCKGNTPLHIACRGGYTEVVLTLLDPVRYEELSQNQYDIPYQKIPQNLDVKNYEGQTCLHLATEHSHLDIICILLSKGANINAQDGKSGRTVLHYATEAGLVDVIELLVTFPSLNLNAETYGGETAIDLARGRQLENIANILITYGATQDNEQEEMEDSDIYSIHAPWR